MATYKKTPGVYVDEISTLPPSVADVATAIPAFIGYTQFAYNEAGKPVDGIVPRRISTMLEYERYFGSAFPSTFTVETTGDAPEQVDRTPSNFILYYALKLYFDNGGGPCYIVSVGDYLDTPNSAKFLEGLDKIALEDEPTLLVFPEAIYLSPDDYKDVCNKALEQCKNLGDRFTIMDVQKADTDAKLFRGKIRSETEYLKYGAAYMPFLKTSIPFEYKENGIKVKAKAEKHFKGALLSGPVGNLKAAYTGALPSPKIEVVKDTNITKPLIEFDIASSASDTMIIKIKEDKVSAGVLLTAWALTTDRKGFDINPETTGDISPFGPAALEITAPNYSVKFPGTAQKHFLTIKNIPGRTNDPAPTVVIVPGATATGIIPAAGQLTINVADGATLKSIVDAWNTVSNGAMPNGFAITPGPEADLATPINITGDTSVTLTMTAETNASITVNTAGQLSVKYDGSFSAPKVAVAVDGELPAAEPVKFVFNLTKELLTIQIKNPKTAAAGIIGAWTGFTDDKMGFKLESATGTIQETPVQGLTEDPSAGPAVSEDYLNTLKDTKTARYNQVRQVLAKQRVELPPSPAIAGIYARVDRDRGVWKSPANVSVMSVNGLTQTITADDQENLNVDADAGKSINVIRGFTGKGILVWGARTLAGNDNEWRYISVRRLFNLIEESVQKSTSFAVFEPNDAGTWLKVKAMIDSYLYGLWQQGALAGSVPEQAYVVNVGLGKTMTTQDILEGRMNVEIGLAAVRPAEFIYLKFSHKLQEA